MSVVSISTNSYSKGNEIAENVSREMGYEYVGQQVILCASKNFGVPESRLFRAIKDVPSIFDIFSNERQRCIAYIEAALAEYMLKDNIVYHGLVGYPFIKGVSHVLKVQIIAYLEDRIHLEMNKQSCSYQRARKSILNKDEQKKKWAKATYGIDITNPSLYDLVINVGHIGTKDTEDAAETIMSTVMHKKFQPMTYSLNCLENSALSCRVRALLIDTDPKIQVKSSDGIVYIYTKVLKRKKRGQVLDFKKRVMNIDGVEHVELYADRNLFSNIARGQ